MSSQFARRTLSPAFLNLARPPKRFCTCARTRSVAAMDDNDLDALLPDEGFQILEKPKHDAQPKG